MARCDEIPRGMLALEDRRPSDADLSRQLLDLIRDAAAVLNPEGQLLYVNAAAARIFAAAPFAIEEGRLRGRTGQAEAMLRRMLSDAGQGQPQLARFRGAGAEPLILSVSARRAERGGRHLFVLAHGCSTASSGLPASLRAMFGLTRAEAEIAIALARGMSIASVADRRRVAAATVRGQIKAIFAKTGCASRVELATLVAHIPVPDGFAADCKVFFMS